MPDHRLHKQARNIRCKVQKTNKSKIISSGWVLDIMKTFKRWGVKDLLELSGDAMKYVIIEDRLLKAPRITQQDAKMTKLEY